MFSSNYRSFSPATLQPCHIGPPPLHKTLISSVFCPSPTKMAHISRLSTFLLHTPRFYSARFSSSHAGTSTASSINTLPGAQLPRSTHVPSLIVFDAPSQPSENLTRRSARSAHSLSDYYNGRRRLGSHSSRQVRSTTSNSAASAGPAPLSSVPHPENVHARIFDSPSKPREYYTRPQPKRDLPELKVKHICLSR
jgi:hypothetical protein